MASRRWLRTDDAVVLGELADVLHEVLAPLLGERGDRDADDLAVVQRVEAEVGRLDRLLDLADDALVVRLDDEQAASGAETCATWFSGVFAP